MMQYNALSMEISEQPAVFGDGYDGWVWTVTCLSVCVVDVRFFESKVIYMITACTHVSSIALPTLG